MLHKQLERQIKKHFGENLPNIDKLDSFIKAISESYANYDRDRELGEHAFSVNETEYNKLNEELKNLNAGLENEVEKRTKEIQEVANFPIQNPSPIIRIKNDGSLLFKNPAASQLKEFIYENKIYLLPDFFNMIVPLLKGTGQLEVIIDNRDYILQYVKIQKYEYINFYGWDITEKNLIEKKSYDNFFRLNNFLESTDEAYYIIYNTYKEKNIFTSMWGQFYGFNPSKYADAIKERIKFVQKESREDYDQMMKTLQKTGQATIRYSVKNKITKELFWLEETINKRFDPIVNDTIISGRISNVTNVHIYSLQVKESEKRFELITEALPSMIWVSDKYNRIIYSNKATKNFLGFSLEQMKRYSVFTSRIHPADRKQVKGKWNKALPKHQKVNVEYRVKDKDNKYRFIEENAVPRFFENGELAGYIGSYFDLSERKNYQDKLNEEIQKLDTLTRHSPDIIFLISDKGVIEYVSPSVNRIMGFEPRYMEGKKIDHFISKECISRVKAFDHLQRSDYSIEYRMVKKNGDIFWVESASSLVKSSSNGSLKILMHNRDITALKTAEEILKASEQKYRGLFENMQLGVMEVDMQDNIIWINDSYERITGYLLEEIKGKNATKLFLPDLKEKKKMQGVRDLRRDQKESNYETKIIRKDGNPIEIVISGAPIVDRNKNVTGSIGLHWDISKMKAMERQIAEEALNRQKEILEVRVTEEERQKEMLGHELHDSVGQMLTYTSLFLQVIANAPNPDISSINKAQQKIQDTLNEVRRISRSLAPPALHELGLKVALIEFLSQYAELKKPKFKLVANKLVFKDLVYEAQIMIYRIVQEITNNTLKYANANLAKIIFSRNNKDLVLKYTDDGNGFDQNNLKKGVGLKSIKTRVNYYEGEFHIKSEKGMGVEFIITLPLLKITKQ
ncbi:MAG: PAS domain S-box protein [Chitinophagaceae bacterium]